MMKFTNNWHPCFQWAVFLGILFGYNGHGTELGPERDPFRRFSEMPSRYLF